MNFFAFVCNSVASWAKEAKPVKRKAIKKSGVKSFLFINKMG
jgi:hypothetical protein